MENKIKWFSYLNDNPKMVGEYFDYYKVARLTQKINAPSLEPYLIYDGDRKEVLEFCDENEVNVIKHKSRIHDQVTEHYQKYKPTQVFDALACFLKPEVPLIVKDILKSDDKNSLLTDSDVMFFNDPTELTEYTIKYIGVSSEFDINLSDFNAGVMWFNNDTMYDELDDFQDFIVKNFHNFQVFDQDAYKQFYGKKAQKIPVEYNYKCYWNYQRTVDDIKILHFHGLKPRQYMDSLNGKNNNPLFKNMLTPFYIEMVGYYNCILNIIKKGKNEFNKLHFI